MDLLTSRAALTTVLLGAHHAGTVPLAVVGIALFLAAALVRRIIKLAFLVVLAGVVALVLAAWRGGLFGG